MKKYVVTTRTGARQALADNIAAADGSFVSTWEEKSPDLINALPEKESKPVKKETENAEHMQPVGTVKIHGLPEKTFFCNSTFTVVSLIAPLIARVIRDKFDSSVLTAREFLTLVSALWVVHHNSNKLQGIDSISTSVCDNKYCEARRADPDGVCPHCYAASQQSRQHGLNEHNVINGLILRNVLIPVEYFAALALDPLRDYTRIESFGDVENIRQARNYLRIMRAFPEKTFAVWSKNIAIWDKALKAEGRPENMVYVHSSSKVNTPELDIIKKYPFVNHVFTVYTKKYARENNILINCGGKKCSACIRENKNCYFCNTCFAINELLK